MVLERPLLHISHHSLHQDVVRHRPCLIGREGLNRIVKVLGRDIHLDRYDFVGDAEEVVRIVPRSESFAALQRLTEVRFGFVLEASADVSQRRVERVRWGKVSNRHLVAFKSLPPRTVPTTEQM